MKLAVIPQGCPAVIVNRRKYLVQTNHVFCNAALYNPIHINTAAFVKASLPVTVTWPKEFPQRLVPNHKQKQQKKMKRTILSLVLGAALLCGCNPQ